MKKIKKCSCGSTEFWVTESMLWTGNIFDDDVVLHCSHSDGEITNIECKECGKEYDSLNFEEIEFN